MKKREVDHLSDEQIKQFIEGRVTRGWNAAFMRHFARCDDCRSSLADEIRKRLSEEDK